jgi:MerR family transcriptional regulator, light-induced transcriptional regulator
MISTSPAFNLKVVLKETGLAADTLRAWERRYGLPVPQRTQGGHRLYSQRDIETIKWLMARQAEGLSISRAVDLWNEQTASGSDPLAGSTPSTLNSLKTTHVLSETTLDGMRAEWIKACMSFNETYAEQILNQAFSMFPVEVVCMDVLQKGMSEIGSRWYQNQASVQQEHFASALAMRRLDALISATPAPTQNKIVIVGCPPDEWHTFTPLLLTLLLRRRGINIIYLGANVPAEQFVRTVQDIKADLVVLVAQQLISAATLQQTSLLLSNKKIPVAFGGRIFNIHPDLTETIAGYFLGGELNSAANEIETILSNLVKQQAPRAASPMYVAAHHAYQSKRGQIELIFKQILEPLSISPEEIKTGVHFLGENITAALQLGDMSYVSAEVDWLKTLLQAHEMPPEQLIHFMETYSRAVDKNINGQGKPITEWLAAEIQKLKA